MHLNQTQELAKLDLLVAIVQNEFQFPDPIELTMLAAEAWNKSVLTGIISEETIQEELEMIEDDQVKAVLIRLMDLKNEKFPQDEHLYLSSTDEDEALMFQVKNVKEVFAEQQNELDEDFDEADLDEDELLSLSGLIDRKSILITLKKAFFEDFKSSLDHEMNAYPQNLIMLIHLNEHVERWVQGNFEILFDHYISYANIELKDDSVTLNLTNFAKWFEVTEVTEVYDTIADVIKKFPV